MLYLVITTGKHSKRAGNTNVRINNMNLISRKYMRGRLCSAVLHKSTPHIREGALPNVRQKCFTPNEVFLNPRAKYHNNPHIKNALH